MLEAVFISDLHLNPDEPVITKRFDQFIEWAATNTHSVYILGDFFHVWPGDDAFDSWSLGIAQRLASLAERGIRVFFMPGNRDFLLGQVFAQQAKVIALTEPTVIRCGDEAVLLVHGDRYCTDDKAHQRLRRFTRNRLFSWLFLRIPRSLRLKLVNTVRQHSQTNRAKPPQSMNIVASALLGHMQQFKVNTVIHGHIHQAGLTNHQHNNTIYQQFVLSDWDDFPNILCYNKAYGFHFDLF